MGKPRTEEDKAKIRAGFQRRKAAGLPVGRTRTGKHIAERGQALSDLLGLVGINATPQEVTSWAAVSRHRAEKWAVREHLYANDNLVKRLRRPVFLKAYEMKVLCGIL